MAERGRLMTRARGTLAGSLLADRPLATLLGAILITYLGLGVIIPVRALYAREIGLSLAGIGAMASSFLLFNTLGQVPFGWLTDRLGRKPLIAAGIAVEVVIAVLYLVVAEPWTFIVLRALEGLAAAAIGPAARAYIADVTPPERRGEAYGLLGATFSGGILLGPAIGGWLSAAAGYPVAFAVSAAGRLLALLLVLVVVREPAAHAAGRTAAGRTAAERSGWSAALNPALFGGYLAGFGFGFASGIFFALWSLWLQDRGASLTVIGLSYTAFSLPSLLVTPLAGRLADRIGRVPLIVGPGLLDAVIYLAYGFAGSIWLVLGICALQGIIYAFIMPALDATVADAAPAEGRGRVQGVYSGITMFGSFVSAMLCTVLYGWNSLAPFVMLTVVVGTTVGLGGLLLTRAQSRTTARLRPYET